MATWTKICAKQVQSHAKRSQGLNQKYTCTNNYNFHNKRSKNVVKTSQLLEELVDKCNDKKKITRKNIY